MSVPIIELNDGNKIPQFGLKILYEDKPEEIVKIALNVGCRLFHIAHDSKNKELIGEAIKNSGIPRKDIFFASEIWSTEYGEDVTYKAVDEMLKKFGMDYIDLVFIMVPYSDYVGAYKALERAQKEGKVKSIGLRNFEDEYLDDILNDCNVKPAIDFVEAHPHNDQRELIKKLEPYRTKIMTSTYPEIEHYLSNVEVFKELEAKYKGCNFYDILCQWFRQKGFIALQPAYEETTKPLENSNWELTNEEMEKIAALNQNKLYYTLSREDRSKIRLYAKDLE